MKNLLTRRQALKTIVAATGAVAASSFVPEKWVKPLVKTGVVPVHAQASVDLFQAEGRAMEPTDGVFSDTPFSLDPIFHIIGAIRARLNAIKVVTPTYCANLTIVKSNVEMGFNTNINGPTFPLSTSWFDLGQIDVYLANAGDTITLIFDLYECPALSGPILQTITLTFTVTENIFLTK